MTQLTTSEEVIDAAVLLQANIFKEEYYVELYLSALAFFGLTQEGVDGKRYSAEVIVKAANLFWFFLPDSRSTRREPFAAVCDIAGFDYLEPN